MNYSGIVPMKEFERDVEEAIRDLDPQVVARVRYNIGEDWTGEPLLRFRIILRDSANTLANFHEVANSIRDAMRQRVQPVEKWGIPASFSFRLESEQKV